PLSLPAVPRACRRQAGGDQRAGCGAVMTERQQPKTAEEMIRMRRGLNKVVLGSIAGLAVLFFVLTIVRMGGAG
ncbi:MAG: hypothetical protein ABWW89_10185, partial [SAR116 cluster bacterium]